MEQQLDCARKATGYIIVAYYAVVVEVIGNTTVALDTCFEQAASLAAYATGFQLGWIIIHRNKSIDFIVTCNSREVKWHLRSKNDEQSSCGQSSDER